MISKRLLSWIDVEKLDKQKLSRNHEAITFLQKNPHIIEPYDLTYLNYIHNINDDLAKIDWCSLSSREDPRVINLLEKYPDKIYWKNLSKNSKAIKLIEKYRDIVDWNELSTNPALIYLLKRHIKEIHNGDYKYIILSQENDKCRMVKWLNLAKNPYPINILEKDIDKINWKILSANPNAIHLLEKNLDKINWCFLSANYNAIHLLEQNISKINWNELSYNPKAINILEKHQHEINWINLSTNPSIFEWSRIKFLYKRKIIKSLLVVDLYNYMLDF